jgi:HTH-type transcriptional regulator, competence development regulator
MGAPMSGEEQTGRERAEGLGGYLRSLRTGLGLSLRDVEEATEKEVSNAYLSQLENGKILKPSPNILHTLAVLYGASYQKLMERAGYVSPIAKQKQAGKHGRAATYSVDNLTAEEEKQLLDYLAFIRTQRGRG